MRCQGKLRNVLGNCERQARKGCLTCASHAKQEQRLWWAWEDKSPCTASELRDAAGAGSHLQFVGNDPDGRPVWAGYWDDGTPTVMVGMPEEWTLAFSGDAAPEKLEDELWRATTVARKLVTGVPQWEI